MDAAEIRETFTNNVDKAAYANYLARKAGGQGQPINPADVFVSPELTTISVGFMMDQNTVSGRMAPSVPTEKSSGSYPTFPRSFWFRDEMTERADAQPAVEGTLGLSFVPFKVPVYAWKTLLGAQARANAKPIDLDQAGTRICTNKAILKREILWFSTFYKTNVWTTQQAAVNSGGGGTAGVNLTWADASAKPIQQIKAQLDAQSALVGDQYRANRGVFSRDSWTTFCEHPNVVNRINAGQTPGGPAEATQQMVASWLGLKEVIVAGGIKTTSNEGATSDTYARIAASGSLLLAYVPDAPGLFEPSAMYTFDWVPPDSMVGGYGNAVASWWTQDRKAQTYEIEMATLPAVVSADCGVFMSNLLTAP